MGRKENKSKLFGNLKQETKSTVIAIVFFVVAIILVLASFGKAGLIGTVSYGFLEKLLGIGYHLLPLILILVAISFFAPSEEKLATPKLVGGLVFFISGIAFIDLLAPGNGGWVGAIVSKPLLSLFDFTASIIFLIALVLISILVIFDSPLKFGFLRNLFNKDKKIKIKEDEPVIEGVSEDEDKDEEKEEKKDEKTSKGFLGLGGKNKDQDEEELELRKEPYSLGGEYTPPPLSLLEGDKGKPGVGDIKANANIIKRTLQNFGISVEMDEVSVGPSVTRYAVKPAEGVKLARIVALNNDLALALAAHPIRIEAPIPGKSLVGIEVPNQTRSIVGLGTLLGSDQFKSSHKPLYFAIGKSISGSSHFASLDKMPHLLIAGATGSGKSVSIHTIITSLLYRNSPENLKFIMVDPKRVELTLYKKIPHLLTPVITDAKKAILALKWAAKEMSRRYDVLEQMSVRDITSYHENILKPEIERGKKSGKTDDLPEPMPYIVIVIDELADIMSSFPRELESAIVRLAQMSRAVGIHLILSTQRPSVNVITGLIKANIPARIALQVTSQIDSRTILDGPGAEKLLGAGDLLFQSAEMSKPLRIQSAFINEDEVKKVVNHLAKNYEDQIPEDITISADGKRDPLFETMSDENLDDDDDLYEEAKLIVIEAGKASTSYLQRKLRVGYARAARLMDMLEERGIIGPADGSKPREVISFNDSENEEIDQEESPIEEDDSRS